MARVFDIPRYHDQTVRRIAYFLNTPGYEKTSMLGRFDQSSAKKYMDGTADIVDGMDDISFDSTFEADDIPSAEFQHFCHDQAYKKHTDKFEAYSGNIAEVFNSILARCSTWFSDEGGNETARGRDVH